MQNDMLTAHLDEDNDSDAADEYAASAAADPVYSRHQVRAHERLADAIKS